MNEIPATLPAYRERLEADGSVHVLQHTHVVVRDRDIVVGLHQVRVREAEVPHLEKHGERG